MTLLGKRTIIIVKGGNYALQGLTLVTSYYFIIVVIWDGGWDKLCFRLICLINFYNRVFMNTQVIRDTQQYKKWKKKIKQRDGRRCKICGNKASLSVHHIERLETLKEKYNITSKAKAAMCSNVYQKANGICLCEKCHKLIHKNKIQFKKGFVYEF